MNNTPNANRKHIGIYGNTNSGKSSLMNKILGQEISLVSSVEGTTTDPVQKAMELIPFGPVLLIDTAGLEDKSELGKMRIKKSYDYLKRLDFAMYVVDGKNPDISTYKTWKREANKYNIPHIVVVNKLDKLKNNEIDNINKEFKNPIYVSAKENTNIDSLKETIIKKLETEEEDRPIVGDLLDYGSKVVLVVPIDSEAPKGRIILPQVQVIRDCLDHGIKTYVVRDTELVDAIKDLKDIDLVITDSQAFKEVDAMIPKDMKLTSFSILFARQKGELKDFINGARKLKDLKPGQKVLMCESCTHNISHEDIGRVKIPKILEKIAGGKLDFDFKVGYDFANDIENYDLVIHCGACMVNRKSVINKINLCKEKNIPITNYGLVIAYFTGILDRSIEIFK
ncbi:MULTISPECIES: [FeFe] hydrogenase H-cluster maturation GTPase HydF [Romboutsia]|uniref:Small GTP-binding protein n=1 Tax=Romboutsia hominis TaxID=1507512 RepID=A0A2P2BUK8_9FIRM|nr:MULTISPECIES: [FeFe] hydrogenase H-cluster maturation GTPase HydF [Romboutsia]MCH1969557.1 [FeFe] hydrogenase H-cluster maturation GTPase HydF [Romboutsia hominis]MDB8791913.1 [FeFe] hydrogenase H-cluster maturation GTPase HydF [Romboutsia sp. 1001216sp1]MDB8794530.1 [FeFe] hydrogenase H-cluster maturation GTPase HydF [Romboutsia sp. 1001216sp1]MDB8796100.1 [FeFe] hydrogenase H-cluster maturation GTPase HydF [Romboutsia sp. 1001216sp1]MDB8798093.1 [FeFe] hydrogenase H-cluster maturation GTP